MNDQFPVNEGTLFEWPDEKPIERAVKQFASDLLVAIATNYESLSDLCDDPSKNDFRTELGCGAKIRVDWRLQRIVKAVGGERSPKTVLLTCQPESREFHFSAKMDFRPYLEIKHDTQANRMNCYPAKSLIQGGSGDMESCYRWLTLWKLCR